MAVDRKAFEKHFETFSTTTVLRVFNFIRTSQFLIERLFWLAVLVAFSIATIVNVTQTINTYLAEPTASQVSFVSISTHGISFPRAKLCFQTSSSSLLQIYEGKIDDAIAQIENLSDYLKRLSAKLKVIHEREEERARAFVSRFNNLSLLGLAKGAFGLASFHEFDRRTTEAFSEGELALLGITTAMLVRLVDPELNPTPFFRELVPVSPSVRKLYGSYVNKKANFSQLLRLTAEATCVLLQVRLLSFRLHVRSNLHIYTPYNFCKNSPPVLFGVSRMEVVCFQVSPQEDEQLLAFYSNEDQTFISMHAEALYRNLTANLNVIYMDFAGTLAATQQPLLEARFNTGQLIAFSLDTISTSLNLRRSGCLEEANRRGVHFQCELWCRIESIAKHCDCEPLLATLVQRFAQLPKNLSSCALRGIDLGKAATSGKECRSTVVSDYDRENCSQVCHSRNCETMIFTSTVTDSGGNYLLAFNATTAILLMMNRFMYQKVDEYLIMDPKTLVASLGGNLSLYLGASFLALIHIVVFFVKLPFEAYCQTNSKTVQKMQDSHSWIVAEQETAQ